MTQKQLKSKVNQCLKSDKALIQKLIDKAINSGCMDIEGAEDNYILAKNLLTAIYKEMSRQYSPMDGHKQQKENVQNIYINL